MGQKINNLKKTFSDTKMRGIFIALGLVIAILVIISYVHLKTNKGSIDGGANIAGVPGIRSVPGVGDPSREYSKLLENQNVSLAEEAARKNTAAIPTLTRATYLEGGVGSTLDTGCSAEDLKRARMAGVTAAELRCRGCSLSALRNAGFTAGELHGAGFGVKDLKDAGYDATELREAGFTARELADVGFNAKDLAKAGFEAVNLKDAGFSIDDIKNAGFSLHQLKDAGFKAKDLVKEGFGASELAAVDFSVTDLKEAGFNDSSLKSAGFDEHEIKATGKNCSVIVLKGLRTKGVSPENLKKMGCSAVTLKAAGFTAAELKDAGYAAKYLKDAGYGSKELKVAGFNAKDLNNAGFNADDLKDAGFSANDLESAGFNAGELKQAGFSADELKKAGFDAQALRAAGFSANDLGAAGFSGQDLKTAGFSEGDLIRAGLSDGAGLTGFSNDKNKGTAESCNVEDVTLAKAQGIGMQDLKKRGCSLATLKDAGFSAQELKNAGFDAKALKAVGFSAQELKNAGFDAKELQKIEDMAENVENRNIDSNVPQDKSQQINDVTDTKNSFAKSSPQLDENTAWQKIRAAQTKNLSKQEYSDKVKAVQQAISVQTSDLFASWTPLPVQQYVQGNNNSIGKNSEKNAGNNQQNGDVNNDQVDIFKAGSIMFAILDTGINSDEKSPIMATVIDGALKGAKVLGSFQRTEKKVVLQFNILNVPYIQSSLPINAVAIDPNTAKTALATKVDNHYLLRYGTLFAASFMQGVGQAVQDSSSSVTINTSTGENINFHGSTNASKAAVVGLGQVGSRLADVWSPIVNKPPTVEVKASSGIGLLLMSDLSIPKKGK